MDRLPTEILCEIFGHIRSLRTWFTARAVSHLWQSIIDGPAMQTAAGRLLWIGRAGSPKERKFDLLNTRREKAASISTEFYDECEIMFYMDGEIVGPRNEINFAANMEKCRVTSAHVYDLASGISCAIEYDDDGVIELIENYNENGKLIAMVYNRPTKQTQEMRSWYDALSQSSRARLLLEVMSSMPEDQAKKQYLVGRAIYDKYAAHLVKALGKLKRGRFSKTVSILAPVVNRARRIPEPIKWCMW